MKAVKTKGDLSTKQKSSSSLWSGILKNLQEFGKAVQYPISILPFCAILVRLGALGQAFTSHSVGEDLIIDNQIGYWVSHFFFAPANVAFDNLALFFAIGIAFGLAKDHRGEAALVGCLFFLALNATLGEGALPTLFYQHVLTSKDLGGKSNLLYVLKGAKPEYSLNLGVLGGIISGALSAWAYNKFKDIQLPKSLSFFGGRRFIPMIAICMVLVLSIAIAAAWPWIQYVFVAFGQSVKPGNQAVAIPCIGVYAFLNRILLPFGLHQVLNVLFWFQLPFDGDKIAPITGKVIGQTSANGDINAFTQGISGAGLFQSGFFPIMMGGLPAAAVAMIFAAPKDKRKEVAGFLGGVAGIAFLSGITEPIEFSFVFIAPALYGIHAFITAVFSMIIVAMQIQVGFAFSAGFIDYAVSFAQSWGYSMNHTGFIKFTSNPLWILVLSAAASAIYFLTFTFWIRKFDIKTPGRDELVQGEGTENNQFETKKVSKKTAGKEKCANLAAKLLEIVGPENVDVVDNCATRLRLQVKDTSKIDEAKIKATGVFGSKKLGQNSIQIIVGPDVEHVANAFEEQWKKSIK